MRSMKCGIGAVMVALALVLTAGPAAAQSERPTVAVIDFDYGTVQQWWSGNWDIGKGIADMLVDELVNDGSFRMIERARLDAILAEQDFSNSERAAPSAKTMAALGKALGVKYLIVGSITQFGTENSKSRFGGGGFGGRILGGARVGTSKGKATVGLTARILDTTTGEIMVSKRGEGTSKRSGLLLGASGAGAVGGFGDIEMGSSDFRETVLGEATEEAVRDTAAKLVESKDRLSGSHR